MSVAVTSVGRRIRAYAYNDNDGHLVGVFDIELTNIELVLSKNEQEDLAKRKAYLYFESEGIEDFWVVIR